MLQILRPDATIAPDHESDVDLGADELLELYRLMTLSRRIDTEGANLQRQGQLGLWVPLLGEEATQVGSAYALERDDWLFFYGREHAAGLARGIKPAELAHVWRGTWHGGLWDFRERGVAPYTIPIGTQVPHAVGFALGAKLDGANKVVLVYTGDGATSTGDFHAGATMAGVWKVPVVIVIRNNQYAISVPLSKQTAAPTLSSKAIGYGFPGMRVDGNDVLAVYVASRAAVNRARDGDGATLIEAVTFRRGAHSTADDASRYRSEEEVKHWEALDPVDRFERFLTNDGTLSAKRKAAIADEADAAAAELREAIIDAPPPDPAMLLEHVYEQPTPNLQRQQEQLRRESDG